MKDNSGMIVIGLFIGLIVGVIVGATVGQLHMEEVWMKAAIENNSAEWRIDPKTGATEFVWLTVEELK